ncbi:MAG TPA: hypothetical protein VEG60_08280, partial [Candidatus Binatia bacterium]|nr:hypothetical protein [Candidatus Binatia bacterium]
GSKFIMLAFHVGLIIAGIIADLRAAESTDDWTSGVAAVTTSATGTLTPWGSPWGSPWSQPTRSSEFTVAGYEDGSEYTGFHGWAEPRGIERRDK